MDIQTILDTATTANATTLGAGEAGIIFRKMLKSTINITVNLNPKQQNLIRKSLSFPVIFVGGKNVTNDHPVLVAYRDIVRKTFYKESQIDTAAERILVVGAAAREIRMYNNNPHVHYYIHGSETKDYDRIIRPALMEINKMLKIKATKTDKRVFLQPGDANKCRPAVKRYWNFTSVFRDYMEFKKLPGTIHTNYVGASTLVFEDSFYNFSADDFIDAFDRTGAQVAYGYGLLPMKLLFPDMPSNPLYMIHRNDSTGKTTLIFRQRYCNGYVHDTKKWETLIKTPILTHSDSKVKTKLAVKITSRAGPAVTFKLMRAHGSEHIARLVEPPPQDSYVRVLDIKGSIDYKTGKARKPLVYFSMREDEYMDVYNYALSLDPKSVTFANIVSYIRRRMGGMSLITKELVECWYLEKRQVDTLALNVLLEMKSRSDIRDRIIDNIQVISVFEKFKAAFCRVGRVVFWPIVQLLEWLYAGHLVDKLVLYPDGTSLQFAHVQADDSGCVMDLYADHPFEGECAFDFCEKDF